MYKYIALDLDGTLLRSNHEISQRSVDVLKKLQEAGIVVILCSGRSISQMNVIAEKINSDHYDTFIVSSNGGVVTEINKGVRTTLRNLTFESGELEAIADLVDGRTKVFSAISPSGRYLKKFRLREALRAMILFHEIVRIGIPKTASKILLVDKKEHIEDIYQDVSSQVLLLYPHLNVFRSVPTLIEITPSGSTKGQGLELVFKAKHWDPNELIVFGDGENDISMFQMAGKAIAMANAFDTVKLEADDICRSNDEDGVAQYLEHIYAGILN